MPLGTLDRDPPPFFRQGPSALSKLAVCGALALFLMVADARFKVMQPLRVGLAATALSVLLGTLAALGLALLVSLGVYLAARPWVLQQLAGPGQRNAERMFDSVYRAARALEQSPGQAVQQLGRGQI